jgi:hypothetical protein
VRSFGPYVSGNKITPTKLAPAMIRAIQKLHRHPKVGDTQPEIIGASRGP